MPFHFCTYIFFTPISRGHPGPGGPKHVRNVHNGKSGPGWDYELLVVAAAAYPANFGHFTQIFSQHPSSIVPTAQKEGTVTFIL